MTAIARTSQAGLGIAWVLVGMTTLALQDSVVKFLSTGYPLHQVVMTRSMIALVLIVGGVALTSGLGVLRTRRPFLHIGRALLLVVANCSYFVALAAMPLAETMAIFFVAPLLITVLSIPVLGERVGPKRWIAVLIGLAGTLVMLRPGGGLASAVALLPLLAALAYAIMQMITRRLGVTDRASTMAFYIQVSFVVAGAGMGLVAGDGRFAGSGDPSLEFLLRAWSWPGGQDAVLFVACGVLIAIGSYALSQAYRVAEATVVAPFEYVALPIAVLLGFAIWGDLPDLWSGVGIAMIIGAGLFVFHREGERGRLVAARRPMPRNR